MTLHWRHNDHDGVSNHQPHGCLLNRLFRRRSKKTSKRHWPLCGEFTGTGEFPAQRASFAENVSIWWRHHEKCWFGHWLCWSTSRKETQNKQSTSPADTQRTNNAIMTSKRRRDVVLTSWWRYYCVVCPLGRRWTWIEYNDMCPWHVLYYTQRTRRPVA